MNQQYINTAESNVDGFIQRGNWFFNLKINHYEIVMILWNMALVLVPWLMAVLLRRIWQRTRFQGFQYKLSGVFVFLIWLLFIPNSAYMITEVRHLLDYCPRDAAFQICEEDAWIPLFFFAYALFGWVSFVCLTDQMRSLLEDMYNRTAGTVFVIVLMPVMALGVLLGLFNRATRTITTAYDGAPVLFFCDCCRLFFEHGQIDGGNPFPPQKS